MSARQPAAAGWTPAAVVIVAAFALVCLGWPSRDYYFDGLLFAGAVERVAGLTRGPAIPPGGAALLFHPHHLLYCPLLEAGYAPLLKAGFAIRAWLFASLVSTACGVATLVLFRNLARREGVRPALADAGLALLAVAYDDWHFATQGDTTLPSTLLQMLLLDRMAAHARRPGGPAAAAGLGLLAATGFLVHQSAAVFVPAAAWLLFRIGSRRDGAARAGVFLATAGAAVVAGYGAACVWGMGLRSPDAILGWLHGYVGVDPLTGYAQAYGRWSLGAIPVSAGAFAECLAGPAAVAGPWRAAALLALAGAAAAAAWGLATAWGPARPGRRAFLGALGLALGAHAVFFTYWSVGHARYWTMALPGWILAGLLGLEAQAARDRAGTVRGVGLAWTAALAVGLAVGLGPFRRETGPAANPWLPIVDRLNADTPADGLVVIAGTGRYGTLKAYVPYFCDRYLLVLDWRFADPAVPPATAVARLRDYLAAVSRDRAVFATSDVLSPELDGPFTANHGVTPAMRRALFLPLHPRPVGELQPGLLLWRLGGAARS